MTSQSNTDREGLAKITDPPSNSSKWDLLVEEEDLIRNGMYDMYFIPHLLPATEGNGGEQAKRDAIMLCRGALGCELEALLQYSFKKEFFAKLEEAGRG
ncbi:hypothetical protein MAPG_10893 [Magnaporthiopsis poae ATCC 64411]|uniref:Uncharacterized protein n=1 Tax=Magnaporthiopsis poae (strain ATCC 64411 / 73-15) TaxID=644358 RepID=A0A0C4EDT3_MAGP6|nr:hypothetical protein MAPG_10893 [Magnaporthiopsis poae ATCC 64411]